MAYLVSLKLLIDTSNEDEAIKAAHAAVSSQSDIIDSSLDDIVPSSATLNDSICNDTYQQGEAFADWVIFSQSEFDSSGDQAGFWSNTYGWTTLDLATRFQPNATVMPMSAGNDAILMLSSLATSLLK